MRRGAGKNAQHQYRSFRKCGACYTPHLHEKRAFKVKAADFLMVNPGFLIVAARSALFKQLNHIIGRGYARGL